MTTTGQKKLLRLAGGMLLASFLTASLQASVRIKDLADIKDLNNLQLVGYSLVVGLDGTGDSRRALYTQQSIRNLLQRFGLSVAGGISANNVAAVMVTADLSCFAKSGSKTDVTVSSLGDATSLEGGTLLLTPLVGQDQNVYAQAQGNVSIGGIQIETVGYERYRKNYALVGRIPGGAIVQRDLPPTLAGQDTLNLLLRNPDFTTALRVSQAVDSALGAGSAQPMDAGMVSVVVPEAFRNTGVVRLLALVESIEVTPDQTARVVINERTGTVVVGGRVKLSAAAVSQGSLTVRISAVPVISQPAPFSQGQTIAVPQTMTTVTEGEPSKVTVLNEPASVNDLADALNTLKVTPRDIISIFQALKQAGALQADLVVM